MNEAILSAISKARNAVQVAELCSQQADIIRHQTPASVEARFAALHLDQRAMTVALQGINDAINDLIARTKKENRRARKTPA